MTAGTGDHTWSRCTLTGSRASLVICRYYIISLVRSGIEESLTSTKNHLDKLQAEIAKTLEKISSREKYMNSQLESQLNEYRQLSQTLAQTKEQYKQVRPNIAPRRCLSMLMENNSLKEFLHG